MAVPGHSSIKVSELYQSAIVVHDLEKSMERYKNTLDIGPWEIVDVDSSDLAVVTYHGRPAHHKFRAALTMAGPMQLELIQPVEGDSIFKDFLEVVKITIYWKNIVFPDHDKITLEMIKCITNSFVHGTAVPEIAISP